jgi:hypothetical protein
MVMAGGVLGGCRSLELIESKVLLAAGTFNFLNVPQHFVDLLLVGQLRSSVAVAADNPALRFNADAGANYDYNICGISGTGVISAGGAVAATMLQTGFCEGGTAPASFFSPCHIVIPGYRNALAFKGAIADGWTKPGLLVANLTRGFGGGAWRSLAAVTSILVLPAAAPNTFVAGSQLSLYGLGGP